MPKTSYKKDMNIYDNLKYGRSVLIEFYRGEKIIEGIEKSLKELGIRDAVITSGIGSLQIMKIHLPTSLAKITEDTYEQYDGPLEICSITGTMVNGKCHIHVSAMFEDKVIGGHMEHGCEALYLIEITAVEIIGLSHERRISPDNVMKLYPIEDKKQ